MKSKKQESNTLKTTNGGMMDKITEMIREAYLLTGDDAYLDDYLATEIRQQIGRELFEWRWCEDEERIIREACQLEE